MGHVHLAFCSIAKQYHRGSASTLQVIWNQQLPGDGFQEEGDIAVQVRSNDAKQVGFLADRRRMNVAVTRARRHCTLVCDSETVSGDEFLGRLVQYFEVHGAYLSAAELVPD